MLRLPRRISGATADLLVDRRDALPDGRTRGSGLPFERDREKADSLRQAIDLLVRLPELAREPRAGRGRQAEVRQRSAAGENRPDGLDRVRRLPGGQLGAEQRHSEPGAGGIGRDGRAQQRDASRRLGRALRGGQPRRHEHRSIGRGRRQFGPRAQPVDFRLRLASKHSARRGKRARRFDANGVALLRRLGHPPETVERAGAIPGRGDLGSSEGNVRIGVPRNGLDAGPAEFERLGRTIQPFEQRAGRGEMVERLADHERQPAQELERGGEIALLHANLGEPEERRRRQLLAIELARVDELHDAARRRLIAGLAERRGGVSQGAKIRRPALLARITLEQRVERARGRRDTGLERRHLGIVREPRGFGQRAQQIVGAHRLLGVDQRPDPQQAPAIELGLRRRLRRAVLTRDRFLADGDDALVDAIALKVGQPGRRRNRRERVDLIRRGTAQIDQPVGAGGRVVGRAERGSQQRVRAIVAVSREIGAHHRVGRIAQLRQQPAAADRIERGDERRGVDRASSGLRGQHIHRLLPAFEGGRPLSLPPENRRGAKVHVASPRVDRGRMVGTRPARRDRRLRPCRNRPARRTRPIARAFARRAPAGSRRRRPAASRTSGTRRTVSRRRTSCRRRAAATCRSVSAARPRCLRRGPS